MFLATIAVCSSIIVFFAWWFWAKVGTATLDESIQSLIDDTDTAGRSLDVVCSKCEMVSDGAGAARAPEFLRLLVDKHQNGVSLRLWTKGQVSPELEGLARNGVIRIFRLPRWFPFEGRIIDGRIVHRYFGSDRDLYSPGNYARGDVPDEASEVIESIRSVEEPYPLGQPLAA